MKEEEELRQKKELPKIFTNSIGTKFTLIPADEFMMGSEEDDWTKPVHRVKISKPFYLGIYPVIFSGSCRSASRTPHDVAPGISHGGRARNSENLKNETPVIMNIYVVYYNTIK